MPDKILEQLNEEFMRKARENRLGISQVQAPTQAPAPPKQESPYPEWYTPAEDETPDSSMLNALGVGLWNLVDTGLFGVPGALVKEEEFLDFEDPLAKWTGAIGGFAGFVAGPIAPLKVGMKIGQKAMPVLGKSALKNMGKQSVDEAVKQMKKTGLEKGLSQKAVKDISKGYRRIVNESSIDPRIRGLKFEEKTKRFLTDYAEKAVQDGVMDEAQARSITKLVGDNIFNRPIQDFLGLMQARGLYKTNPRLATAMGHMMNDVVMFGTIDTVFEGVSMIEDGDFDFTAPLWGLGTGALFGTLGFLKPRGKAASFKKDFTAGLKLAFSNKYVQNASRERLKATSKHIGEQLKKNGDDTDISWTYGGKTESVDLGSPQMWDNMKAEWGDKAEDSLRALLESEKNKFGKKMMRWSITEEASSLQESWARMALGGIFFNAHSFYDMYAHDVEPDVNDVLPNFLIGAYVQRRTNTSKFDINSKRNMNQLRGNMMILGMDPHQMATVPTFNHRYSRFESIFNNPKYEKVYDLAKELEIGGDNEVATKPLTTDETSALTKPNSTFDFIHKELETKFEFIKPMDQISSKDAKTLADELIKIDSRYGNERELKTAKDESDLEVTANFEKRFVDLVNEVKIKDDDNDLKIIRANKDGKLQMPKVIAVDRDLKDKAIRGEIFDEAGEPLFGRDANEDPVQGDEARDLLRNKIDGFVAAMTAVEGMNKGDRYTNPADLKKTIKSEKLLVDIYREVQKFESRTERDFLDVSSMSDRFTLSESFPEYIDFVLRNYQIRTGREVLNAFSRKDDSLVGHLINAKVMHSPELIGDAFLIDDINKVNVVGEALDSDQVAKDKRFLSRVFQLKRLSVIGNEYQVHEIPNTPDGKKDFEVTHAEVDQLRQYLLSRKIDVDKMSNFAYNTIWKQGLDDLAKGSDLDIGQTQSLWNLTGIGAAVLGSHPQGKAAGFSVKLIDESKIKNHDNTSIYPLAIEYNEIVKKMVNDSNGFVVDHSELLYVTDPNYMKGIHAAVTEAGTAESTQSARQLISEMMHLIGTSEKNWDSFLNQTREFSNADPRHAPILLNWIARAKKSPLVDLGKGKGFEIDIKKFTEELKGRLSDNMSSFGWDNQYVQRIYKEAEQKGRDRLIEDSTERKSEKPIDLGTFYKKYRIDDPDRDLSQLSSEMAKQIFDKAVFQDQPRNILKPDVIKDLMERIHVEESKGGKWKTLGELSKTHRKNIEPEIKANLIKILGAQAKQTPVSVLRWDGSKPQRDQEIFQKTDLDKFFKDELNIEYFLVDGRFPIETMDEEFGYLVQREINIFHDTDILNPKDRKRLKDVRDNFEGYLRQSERLFEDPLEFNGSELDLKGHNGEYGMRIIEISPMLDPIAVPVKSLENLQEPYLRFIDEYGQRDGLSADAKNKLKELKRKIDEKELITTDEYDDMMTTLVYQKMFGRASDGDRVFMNFLNGVDSAKLMDRIKLFNTKKYIKHDKEFVLNTAEVYDDSPDVKKVLRRVARNDGFGVAIWNDTKYATIRSEVESFLKQAGLDKDFLNNVIGDAHSKVSGFDSIGFVSRDQLMYMHTIMGNDPYSYNPIKPVISSSQNSPLLFGKTLFIYSPELKGFFNKNKKIDILLAETGAKVYNAVGDDVDPSLVNAPWTDMNNQRRAPIRKISIESLGMMPNKDVPFQEAKISQADANYMNNAESGSMFNSEFSRRLTANMDSMSELINDPIKLKEWIVHQFGDIGMTTDVLAGESTASTLNNFINFAMHSRDANPMSYSDRLSRNKLQQIFMDSIINGTKSATNQWNPKDSHNYGGNAILIPGAMFGLKPTLVDKSGKKIMDGEVMLPRYAADLHIKDLEQEGYKVRFLRNGEFITGDKIFTEKAKDGTLYWDILRGEKGFNGNTLGQIKEALDHYKSEGKISEDISMGIMVRRNPRTRPNDFALMSLKGFLAEQYGNSIAINSLDVANVMEGDYDFDKADFFFSHRDYMWDHVQKSSQYFVQGIDPESLHVPTDQWNLGMDAGTSVSHRRQAAGTANAFKAAIGMVQKVPRALSYLENIGRNAKLSKAVQAFNDESPNQKFMDEAKVIMDRGDTKVVLDYNNLDFFMRSALETQYIVDGDRGLNPDIGSNLRTWKPDFIMPTIDKSYVPNEAKNKGIGFVNDMRRDGNHNKKRVRIFRKIKRTPDGWGEVELTELDRSIINQMMYEYGNLLAVTRDSVYENTGAQKKTEYQDQFNASDKFRNFNRDINYNIFMRLKNWKNTNGRKWKNVDEFKRYFGTHLKESERSFKDRDGKKIKYNVPVKSIIHEDMDTYAKQLAEGERGAPIDRILMNFRKKDPLNTGKTRVVGSAINEIVDDWYSELQAGGSAVSADEVNRVNERFIQRADELTKGVITGVNAYNRKASLIRNVHKKIDMIRNSKMKYQSKDATIKKLENFIEKLQEEIGEKLIPWEYRQKRNAQNLPNIKFVIADEKDIIDGTIHYSTMDAVRNMLPFDWQLADSAKKDLDFIKNIRKIYHGNKTQNKDFLKYGSKTLLTRGQIDVLNNFPELSTFYGIESKLLAKGFEDHGPAWLYQFMQPTQDKRAVGIFNNRPVSIPYRPKDTFDPSSRYRRGMKILTSIAYGTLPVDKAETVKLAKEQLSILQFVEAQNERFFNMRVDRRALIGEQVGKSVNVGGLGLASQNIVYNNIRLPNFDKDFQKLFGDFDGIKWMRDKDAAHGGFKLMNDHLLDFYALVMKLAGKEKEFDSYLNKMHDINSQYIGYDILDPVEYMAKRSTMDKEVRSIVKDVFVDGILETESSKGNKTAADILNSPIYALMGGKSYFRGISLEKSVPFNIVRMRELRETYESMKEIRDDMSKNSKESRTIIDEFLEEC